MSSNTMSSTELKNQYCRWALSCVFALIVTACTGSTPSGGTAVLSWDANSEPDVQGYKIYMATTSGGYGASIATVPMGVTTYTVTGLENHTTYFFAITAYNSSGAESTYSNEVSKTTP